MPTRHVLGLLALSVAVAAGCETARMLESRADAVPAEGGAVLGAAAGGSASGDESRRDAAPTGSSLNGNEASRRGAAATGDTLNGNEASRGDAAATAGSRGATADLFERLRGVFALPAIEHASVDRERRWYAARADYFARVLERGRPYLFHIAEDLAARGMPGDLALLPVIESAFDPFAYSRSHASGLWQIIPETGERLGLEQNWWFDGRRDVIDSTRAALDYLEALHAYFDGDWLLAVAGYNAGERNVERAIARAAAAGEPTDFFGVRKYLPRETRTYVPRLLAVRDLVADPGRFALELPRIANEPRLAVVATGGQLDLGLAARLVGVTLGELRLLNAGANRSATDPAGPHRLVVPVERAAAFATALAAVGEAQRVRWTRHEIRAGDTLYALARRYSTTPDVLQGVNGLDGTMIRAGEHLMIPRAAAWVRVGDAPAGATVGRAAGVESEESRRDAAPAEDAVREVVYVVRPGDSLFAIARRFRLDVGKLLDWNGIAMDDYIRPGQEITLFVDVAEQTT